MKYSIQNKKGVALILSLSILLILTTFLAFLTSKARLSLKQAQQYRDTTKAYYLAKMGLYRAIYELKFHPTSGHAAAAGAGINAQDTKLESWFYPSPLTTDLDDPTSDTSFDDLDGDTANNVAETVTDIGTIKLKIIDSAALVNLNSPDEAGLTRLLQNLPGLNSTIAAAIITERSSYAATNGFNRIEDIKEIVETNGGDFDIAKYYLTVNSFIDSKLIRDPILGTDPDPYNNNLIKPTVGEDERRSPINVNTAALEILEAVLIGANVPSAAATAASIFNYTNTNPIETWDEFRTQFTNTALEVAVNPNRVKNGNNYSTDFTFASDGFFVIHSLGEVLDSQGRLLAKRQIRSNVKIYDVFRISTREDFVSEFTSGGNDIRGFEADGQAEDADGSFVIPNIVDTSIATTSSMTGQFGIANKPAFQRTTWFDSTPIDPADDLNLVDLVANYKTIPGAVKLGYWDNFDENPDVSSIQWKGQDSSMFASGATFNPIPSNVSSVHWNNADSTDPDNELWYDFADNPLTNSPPYSTIEDDDRQWFGLGGFYSSNGAFMPPVVKMNTYLEWEGEMYLRIFNSEGPRSIRANEEGNSPTIVPDEDPGRDYRDVGYVGFRYDTNSAVRFNSFAISTTGHFRDEEYKYSPYDMDNDGDFSEIQYIRDINGMPPPPPSPPPPPIQNASVQPFIFLPSTQPYGYESAPNYIDRINKMFSLREDWWQFVPEPSPFFDEVINSLPGPYTGSIRRKTYRLVTTQNGNRATMSVSIPGNHITLFNNIDISSINSAGSFYLYGNASHPAWDDMRVIGKTGSYLSAAFHPEPDDGTTGLGSDNEKILWGTFSWTEDTNDYGYSPNPDISSVQLLFAGQASQTAPGFTDTYTSVPFTGTGAGGAIHNGAAIAFPLNYVRLYIEMQTAFTLSEPPPIPIFEDATITYLKDTEVFYVEEII